MYRRLPEYLKEFTIETKGSGVDARGRPTTTGWTNAGTLKATLAEADPRVQERWKQIQRPVSHTIVAKGAPQAEEGDRLVLNGRNFYIQGTENPGDMDDYTLYQCEERKDK